MLIIRSMSSLGRLRFIRFHFTPRISNRSPAPCHQPPPIHQTFEIRGYVRVHIRAALFGIRIPRPVKFLWVHDNVEAD